MTKRRNRFFNAVILTLALCASLNTLSFADEIVLEINDGPVEEELAANEEELKSMQDGSMLPTYVTGDTTKDTLIEIVDSVDDFEAFQDSTGSGASTATVEKSQTGTSTVEQSKYEAPVTTTGVTALKTVTSTAAKTTEQADVKSGLAVISVTKAASGTTTATKTLSTTLGVSSGPTVQTTASRQAVINYAKQFLGNPYVYGGTSLTNGCDCSGFVQGVYKYFGVTTGRTSRDQHDNARSIELSQLQPGDLVFYAAGDYVNHVAIYCGDGIIIHAANSATGIITSRYDYRTPYAFGSFLN